MNIAGVLDVFRASPDPLATAAEMGWTEERSLHTEMGEAVVTYVPQIASVAMPAAAALYEVGKEIAEGGDLVGSVVTWVKEEVVAPLVGAIPIVGPALEQIIAPPPPPPPPPVLTSGAGSAGAEAVPSGIGMPTAPAGSGLEATAGTAPPATAAPPDWYARRRSYFASPTWSQDPRPQSTRSYRAEPPWAWHAGLR